MKVVPSNAVLGNWDKSISLTNETYISILDKNYTDRPTLRKYIFIKPDEYTIAKTHTNNITFQFGKLEDIYGNKKNIILQKLNHKNFKIAKKTFNTLMKYDNDIPTFNLYQLLQEMMHVVQKNMKKNQYRAKLRKVNNNQIIQEWFYKLFDMVTDEQSMNKYTYDILRDWSLYSRLIYSYQQKQWSDMNSSTHPLSKSKLRDALQKDINRVITVIKHSLKNSARQKDLKKIVRKHNIDLEKPDSISMRDLAAFITEAKILFPN